jgi:uncharacterized iron-regulated membrane protein
MMPTVIEETQNMQGSPAPRKPSRGLLRRFVERPRQLWLRKAVFQVHLWGGLLVALYVIAIGVSGSILVFKEELMPKPRVSVGQVDYKACTADQLIHAMDVANTVVPEMKSFLASCPTPANSLFTITVRPQPRRVAGSPAARGGGGPSLPQWTVYLHPRTAAVLGQADREASWVETVEQFHVNLLLGRSGRLWNGIGSAALLALAVTGIVLWWPGIRNWTRGLKLNLGKSWKRINFDLHSALGFWTIFFSLTWALTGIYFTWPRLFTVPIAKISPIVTANYPAAQIREAGNRFHPRESRRERGPARAENAQAQAGGSPMQNALVDVRGMIAEAQRQSPDGHLEGVFYGTGPRAMFTVYMARGILGDYSNTDFVYFDQRSGRHMYTWHRGQNHTLGDWLVWLVAPLHFGTSWGQTVKALWALLGLALPLLTITGMLMYWNRYLSKRWRRLTAPGNR